uniref:Uncharacterized protein n=1 Tax=Arundo donax TaxID=35708 RepID=A0A0A9HH97_ARUDO
MPLGYLLEIHHMHVCCDQFNISDLFTL